MKKTFLLFLLFAIISDIQAQKAMDSAKVKVKIDTVSKTDSLKKPISKVYELKAGTVQPGVISPSSFNVEIPTNASQSTATNQSAINSRKAADHSPNLNDSNYTVKYEEWKKNYPKEFNSLMKPITDTAVIRQLNEQAAKDAKQQKAKTVAATENKNSFKKVEDPNALPSDMSTGLKEKSPLPLTTESADQKNDPAVVKVSKKDSIVVTKIAEHAPDLNDTAYKTKKEAWIKKYPDEYNKVAVSHDSVSQTATKSVTLMKIPANNIPTSSPNDTLTGNIADVVLLKERLAWLKKNDTSAYRVLIGQMRADSLAKAKDTSKVVKAYTPPVKMAEHAPLFTDPDYSDKKDEWIRNYPDEYNKILKPSVDSAAIKKDLELLIENMKKLKVSNPDSYKETMERFKNSDPVKYQAILKSEQ